MKFMVVATPVPEVDRGPIQAAETVAVDELRRSGFIEQIFVRGDGSASMSIVEAPTEDDVRSRVETLPFFQAGAMTVDIFDVRVL